MNVRSATLVCFTIFFCVHCPGSLNAADRNFSGKRAMLDADIDRWTDRDQIDLRLKRVKEAGFNVYVPTVWQGRGTTWPSKYAQWDPTVGNRSRDRFDPLAYVIAKAHEMGLEVHPWFTVVLRWYPDSFLNLALPDVFEGKLGAFDVHNPAFRRFITSLIEEVVTNYDVDGINLDYIRAMGLCRSKECAHEYLIKYGRDLTMDSIAFRALPAGVPTLFEYQADAVSGLVKQISDAVRNVKPSIMISADVHPELTEQPRFLVQGQKSIDWVNRGLVDVLFRMDYHRAIDVQATESVRTHLKYPDSLTQLICNMSTDDELAPGQKHFAREGKWFADTIAMIQTRWPKTGVAVYFYKYLSDDQIAALKSGAAGTTKTSPAGQSNNSH